jgi:hypothetical protein
MTEIAAPNPLGERDNIATRTLCQRIKPAFAIVRHDDNFASTTAIFRRPAGALPLVELPSGTLKHRPAIDAFFQFNQFGILRHDPSASVFSMISRQPGRGRRVGAS